LKLHPFLSFKNKLLIFALSISLIPIVAITTIYYFNSRSTLKDQISMKLTAVADSKKIHVDYLMKTKKEQTIHFSTDGFIRNRFERIVRKTGFIQDMVIRLNTYLIKNKQPVYEHLLAIILVDRQGKVISATNNELIGMDMSDQEVFKQGITGNYGEAYVDQPHYAPYLDTNSLLISTPLISRDGKETMGIIINAYSLASLNEITTDRTGMGKTGEVYLVNRDKLMITESRFIDDAPFKQTVDTEPVRRILDHKEEIIGIYYDYVNNSVIGISMNMPEYGWILLAETFTTEAFEPLRLLIFVTSTILIAGIGAVTVSGTIFARSASKPINDLTRAAKKLAEGRLEYRVNIQRNDEIGILASSFDTMAGELDRLVTDIKRSEKELLRYSGELKRSNEELQHFAYVASHDLQEPLRMISSYLQLIERRYRGKLDKDADEFIAYAVDGANRLQTMINALLEYSRIDRSGKPFEPVNFENILECAILNLELVIKENKATITHDPLPTVMADSSQLLQVFQNLISNAIKFHGEEPPRIHISAKRKENEWVFSIRDNGIGIEPEYVKQLFTIFKRLHGREHPGIGLGLSICKKIVNRHDGQIWLESEPGKGSTFYFTLPMRKNVITQNRLTMDEHE
jgi:signal transduction histidine kinase